MRIVALIADDHALFRQAVGSLLKNNCGINEVIESGSFESSMRCLRERDDISLAVMDLYMPGVTSASSMRIMRETFPRLHIVVLTSSTRRQDILDALAAGVHGFVRKTASPDEICLAIIDVMNGKVCIPAETVHFEDCTSALIRGMEGSPLSRLTPRQVEILGHVKSGLSNKHIARALSLSENTVKVHINAIYRALGIRNRRQILDAQENALR